MFTMNGEGEEERRGERWKKKSENLKTAVKRIPSDLYMLFMDELLLHKPRESIVLHKGLEIRVYTKHSWQSVYYEVRTREIKSRTVRIMTALAMVVSQEGDFSPAHIDLGSNTTATTSKKKKKKKKRHACTVGAPLCFNIKWGTCTTSSSVLKIAQESAARPAGWHWVAPSPAGPMTALSVSVFCWSSREKCPARMAKK